jgi:hypothetical protein
VIDCSIVENAAEFPSPHPFDAVFHSQPARERRMQDMTKHLIDSGPTPSPFFFGRPETLAPLNGGTVVALFRSAWQRCYEALHMFRFRSPGAG